MKFNLKEALVTKGFTPIADPFGCAEPGQIVQKTFERDVETVWHGTAKDVLTVMVRFTSDYEAVTVKYFRHVNTPLKVKSHRSNKRAYNAIEDTIRLRGFAI